MSDKTNNTKESETKRINFHSTWNKTKLKGERFDQKKRIMDTLGYVPKAQRIQNYMNAGINLLKFRAENYDIMQGEAAETALYNPYRDVGKDFSDVQRHAQKLEAIIKKNMESHRRAVEQEAKRQAAMASEKNTEQTAEAPKAEPK